MVKHAWGHLLKHHYTHMVARNLAPLTIRLYRHHLINLSILHPRPHKITTDDLVAIIGRGTWGPDAKRSARSAYRSLFKWAFKSGRLLYDPSEDLPSVKKVRRLPRPTPQVILEQSLRDTDQREQFMIELGAFGGLRCKEIARVHSHDWDGYRRRLCVHGKGGKDRIVPITDDMLLTRLDELTGWAFPNRWTGLPLSAGHVSVLLSRALNDTWTGHTLRHRFGTEALEDTKDLAAVAEVMGHEQIETTRLYTRIGDERMVAVSRGARRRSTVEAA